MGSSWPRILANPLTQFYSDPLMTRRRFRCVAGGHAAAALLQFLQQFERPVAQAPQAQIGTGRRAGHVASAACAFSTSA